MLSVHACLLTKRHFPSFQFAFKDYLLLLMQPYWLCTSAPAAHLYLLAAHGLKPHVPATPPRLLSAELRLAQ